MKQKRKQFLCSHSFCSICSVRIYWCFCNSRFTIATSNAFEKLKRKSNNNQRTNKKTLGESMSVIYHVSTHAKRLGNCHESKVYTFVYRADFRLHYSFHIFVSLGFTRAHSIQWFPLLLSVYIILGATLFLLFASVCDFLPRIISFWLYAWCWFFGANRSL